MLFSLLESRVDVRRVKVIAEGRIGAVVVVVVMREKVYRDVQEASDESQLELETRCLSIFTLWLSPS